MAKKPEPAAKTKTASKAKKAKSKTKVKPAAPAAKEAAVKEAPDKPVVKNITRKKAKAVADAAKEKADALRKAVEYPKVLATMVATENQLQVEVAQLRDQASSDLPDEKLIDVNEALVAKALELASILSQKKKLQSKVTGE